MEIAALFLCLLLAIQVVFQTKIATGAPYGHISYGGAHKGTLPKTYRILSAVFVIVYLFFISVVVAYASDLSIYPDSLSEAVLWAIVIFFGLGTLANAASRSKPERWWALYTLVSLLCTLLVLGII